MNLSRSSGGCPICGKPLRDLERVEAKHTPASVPEHVRGYSVTRRYTIVECERRHRFEAGGGKGPMGWRQLISDPRPATHWTHDWEFAA